MTKKKFYYDAVHIEDNLMIRLDWKLCAKEKMINLLSLEGPIEVDNYFDHIDVNNTFFYIDQNFENKRIKGIEYADLLISKGIKNIWISTNDDISQNFNCLPIMGKTCPWNERY